jgi:hypothetical protein
LTDRRRYFRRKAEPAENPIPIGTPRRRNRARLTSDSLRLAGESLARVAWIVIIIVAVALMLERSSCHKHAHW